MRPWIALAAVAENGVIGNGQDIPWHLPEDFKWFKEKTMGQVIVMGRKTFESIGRPLPGRETLVISRQQPSIPGVTVLNSLDAVMHYETDKQVIICGGAQIYEHALPQCSELFITHVRGSFDGDIFFPKYTHLFTPTDTVKKTEAFKIVRYRLTRKNQKA